MNQRGANIAGVLDVLKGQPLILGLLLVIFALIGFVYLQSSQFNTQRAENVRLFLDVQKEVQKLLSQCIVPPPK
jgi:membrane-anchored glycerophosphoryl diester phosphodiesterase (GDPDase)